MEYKIQPFHNNELDCFEDSIATIVRWLNHDFELMFAYSWEFKYNSEVSDSISKLGDRIKSSNENLLYSLRDFTGIIFTRFDKGEDNIIETIIKEVEKGNPVIANIDTFSCPFSIGFQKVHVVHTIIIVGIDFKKSSYICIDPFYQQQNLIFEFSTFNESLRTFYTITIRQGINISLDWRKVIKGICNRQYKENAFNNIIMFSNELLQLPSLDYEVEGYDDLNQSPLINNLFKIKKQRINFSSFLLYLGTKYDISELNVASDTFGLIGAKWLTIRGLIVKCAFSNSNSLLTKVDLLIKEVAGLEEKATERLLQICNTNYNSEITNHHNNVVIGDKNPSINKTHYITLDNYFNNVGFGNYDNESTANFTNIGAFFLNSGVPKCKIWSISNMKFKFPCLGDGVKDNVSCEGQVISVPSNKYKQICLLGCSEWGNFYDTLTLFYSNGVIETLPVQFTDWVLEPNKNEYTAWEGKGCENKNGIVKPSIFKHRIFAKSYYININNTLEKIKLPDCPNIHIFAISLCETIGS